MRTAIAMCLLLAACSHRSSRPFTLDDAIPERASSFACDALVRGEGWVRRTCKRGTAAISVTVAYQPSDADAYGHWVQMSSAYPQAELPLPAARANGFYDCVSDRCDLHVQLRSGYHVELFGNGTARREDLDALVTGMPLRTLDAN